MRKSQKMRKSRRTHKRQRGGFFGWLTSAFKSNNASTNEITNEEADEREVAEHGAAPAPAPAPAPANKGKTTQVVNPPQGGGMAPINMKDPMFYPTQRQLEWATTAGLPCTKGGRSKRRVTRSKKSKRKSRR